MSALLLNYKTQTSHVFEVEGSYDAEKQKWTGVDILAVTTWSRSSTTGSWEHDPDDDRDDD